MSSLGTELKLARTSAKLSQQAMAVKTGLSLTAVRRSEAGDGSFETFMKLADALGMTVGSRTPLPAAPTIGEQLGIYRQRLGQHSGRDMAEAADLSRKTVTAIEAGQVGHLAALEAMAGVLGVTLCLEKGGRVKFFSGAANTSQHEAWTTPAWILERLYRVVGGDFCLDPCSPTKDWDRAPVRARRYFTEQDDGLSKPWRGKVYMNPPYSRQIGDWMTKAAMEAASGRAEPVIALVPARVDAGWWHDSVVAAGASVAMLRGRVSFGGEGGTAAPFPSSLIMWSGDAGHEERLRGEFPDAWHIAGIS